MKLMSRDNDYASIATFLARIGYPDAAIVRALIREGASTEEAQEIVRKALDDEGVRLLREEV